MGRFTIYNLKFTILAAIFALALYIIHYTLYIDPTFAQTASCLPSASTSPRAEGLVSAPQLATGTKFGSSAGTCVIDPKSAFGPFNIPRFDTLKSIYFDQAKDNPAASVNKNNPITGPATQTNIPMSTTEDQLYYINGDLNLGGNPTGSRTGVLVVEGILNITSNLTYGGAQSGLFFVVKGNVNISQSVTRIDAVIIAEGIICTAFDGTSCPSTNVTTSQLIINGSLLSINQTDQCPPTGTNCPIKFRRTLDPAAAINNSNSPAEKVNHQVKYLVLLRNLYSETVQRWSEIYLH